MWQNFTTIRYVGLFSLQMQNSVRPPYGYYWQGIKNQILTVFAVISSDVAFKKMQENLSVASAIMGVHTET
jgi:hypothetical protein